MLPISYEQQLQIANMFLVNVPIDKIAKQTNLAKEQIEYILATPKVQEYIQRAASNKEMDIHLKRLKRAGELLEKILNKIEEFIDDPSIPVSKWKEGHINLIKDFLYKQLPDTIGKTVQTAIQINVGNQQKAQVPDSIDDKLSLLPAELVLEFWNIIDILLENPQSIYDIKQCLQNVGLYQEGHDKEVPSESKDSLHDKKR